MSYHQFKDEDGEEHGSFEVFYDDADDVGNGPRNFDSNGEPVAPGWYWWSCFPGCMPDGDPMGPFATKQEAIDDAQENGA